jgi:hypothetical protein
VIPSSESEGSPQPTIPHSHSHAHINPPPSAILLHSSTHICCYPLHPPSIHTKSLINTPLPKHVRHRRHQRRQRLDRPPARTSNKLHFEVTQHSLTAPQLAYFFSLVDYSKVKLDYAVSLAHLLFTPDTNNAQNAPRPEDKSVGACKIMVHRLKGTLKDDLEALKAGTAMPEEGTPKQKKPATPRKRRVKDVDAEGEATPTKKSRKKKVPEPEVEAEAEDVEDEAKVKDEPEVEDEK